MTEYIEHNVSILEFPAAEKIKILRPENVMIAFQDCQALLDVGARCYLDRQCTRPRRQFKGMYVNKNSFSRKRAERIRELIYLITNSIQVTSLRPTTVHQKIYNFMKFLDWCDTNEMHEVLNKAQNARLAFSKYIDYLNEKVNTHNLGDITAALHQTNTLAVLELLLDVENLSRGLRLLKFKNSTETATLPPDEDSQGRVLGITEALFNGLSSFVLNNNTYPYQLYMPNYLNLKNGFLWVLPSTQWFILSQTSSEMIKGGYDYNNGCIVTVDQIINKYEYHCCPVKH